MTQKTWMPDRPADNYTDAAVSMTPLYRSLQQINPDLPEKALVSLTRANIQCKWDANRAVIEQALVARFDAMFAEAGYDAGKITIDRDAGTFKEHKERGSRFQPSDYTQFIGQTFTKTVRGATILERNGEYQLIIGEPPEVVSSNGSYQTSTGGSYPVSLTLVDPTGFEVRYPARYKRKPRSCKTYHEVGSPSGLIKESLMGSAQTPAVVFELKKAAAVDAVELKAADAVGAVGLSAALQAEISADKDQEDAETKELAKRLVREYREQNKS